MTTLFTRSALGALVVLLPLALLASGCGIGTVGTAATVSTGDDDDDLVVGRLLMEESSPPLLEVQPQEPLFAASPGVPTAGVDPTSVITLRFNEPVANSATADKFRVSVKRPLGEFVEVKIDRVIGTSSTVQIFLQGTTLLNSLYRVTIGEIVTNAGATVTGTGDVFFVVRDGRWSAPELISSGGDVFGGITLTEEFDGYAVIEGISGSTWYEAVTRAEVGSPWEFPDFVYARTEAGRVQLNTGRLVVTEELGFFQISEGKVNEDRADEFETVLRVPVGSVYDTAGLQFGDVRVLAGDSTGDLLGRVDHPGDVGAPTIPEFAPGVPHFSYPGEVVTRGRSLGVAFWGISDPEDIGAEPQNQFVTQRVYANGLTLPAAPVDSSMAEWGEWGAATQLSAPGIDHNSWPIVAQSTNGQAFAMWWSADTTEGIFGASVGRYWLSKWTPGFGWSPGEDITPAVADGLPAITDVHVVEREVGPFLRRALLVFARTESGPTAREYDLATGIWSGWTTRVKASRIPPVPTFATYEGESPSGSSTRRNYKDLRSQIGRMTPIAEPIGSNEFFVRWVEDTGAVGARATLAMDIYRADAQDPWRNSGATFTSSVVSINADAPHKADIGVAVDPNGWATLVWTSATLSEGTEQQTYARRTNLLVSGPEGLVQGDQVRITPGEFDTISPSLTRSHSSGSVMLGWNVAVDFDPNSSEGPFILGSAASRFQ